MEKILVTGGAGAIGYPLSKYLAEQGHEVFLVDNYLRSKRDKFVQELVELPNVNEICVDLSDFGSYHELPEDIDYVYHMAAYNGTQNFYSHSFDVLLNSTLPTINLLKKYSGSQTLKRFIYAGSSESYACSITKFNWSVPTDETVPLGIEDPLNSRWSYGGSKMHGELSCVAANKQFNTPFTILRYHNIYGPRMGDKHVIPDFIDRARRGCFELYGYDDTRSFLYVTDAVEATVECATHPKAENQIIHLGSEEEVKIIDLATEMMKLMGSDKELLLNPSPDGSVKRRAPNVSKLKRLIQFEPKYSLQEGLRNTIQYYAPELIQ